MIRHGCWREIGFVYTTALAGAFALSTAGCAAHPPPPWTPDMAAASVQIKPSPEDDTRALPLHRVRNGRDLGGLPGRHAPIPMNRFFRSATLSHATEDDKKVLLEHGVKLDLDLRTIWEVMRSPDELAGDSRFHYLNVSLFGVGIGDLLSLSDTTRGDVYVHALAHHRGEFRRVFSALAAERDGAILFHCASGKDRTGVVAAMLLDLAGVDRATIVHNYALSAHYLHPSAKEQGDVSLAIMESPPVAIEQFLRVLDDEYGGARKYLLSVGVSDSDVSELSDRLGQ